MTWSGRLARLRPPHQKEYRAQSGAVRQRPTPTQARSRLVKGEDGPSDSALAAARGGRLRPPGRGPARGALRFSGPVLGRAPLGAIRPRMLSIDSQKPTGATDGAKSETPLENETGSGSAEIRLNSNGERPMSEQ